MHKIYKYDIDPVSRMAFMPKGTVLRVDHVNDGFYHGDFVWVIVDTDDTEFSSVHFPDVTWSACPPPATMDNISFERMKVKEKQELWVEGVPIFAKDLDGELYIYYKQTTPKTLLTGYDVAFYKTGQVIDIDPKRLTYIGLNRLWIIQELGLYTFIVK